MPTLSTLTAFATSCLALTSALAGPVEDLTALLDDVVEGVYEREPIFTGSAIGRTDRNDELPDVRPEAYEAFRERQRAWLGRAEAIDRAGLSEPELLDLDLLIYDLELELAEAAIHPEHTPVTSIGGPQYWLPQLSGFVPLLTEQHHTEYVARLEALPQHIDDTIALMRAGMAAGRVPPKAVIGPAIAQARSQADAAFIEGPKGSPFYKPFDAAGDRYPELAGRAARAISAGIVSAYERLADFMESEYLPVCRETVGISQGVDGVLAYELGIRRHTTLSMTAQQVHDLGLAEVARIRAEMFGVIARSDFPQKDSLSGDDLFRAFTTWLRTDSRFYYDTEEELLAGYRSIAKVIDPELTKLFGVLPRLPYGIREIPLFAAKFSPTAYYYNGSIEEGRPGYFMANTFALDQRPTFDMVALTLHEAVPGHHLQVALAQEIEGQHAYRKLAGYTAFVEGWALYAERLGLEMGERPVSAGGRGLYEDPYADFGRLNYEIWRAMRLVVDSGMHALGWTRQEAIDFMMANSANTELDVINEVDRYIGWPGQALAYKIGELKIRELRGEAERALGGRFDVRAFHDALLGDGPLPLPVLEAKMHRWTQSRR